MASSLHLQPPSRPPSSSPRSSLSSNSSHTHESTAPPPQQLLEQHEMAPIEARSLAPVIKLAANPPLDIPNVDAASQRSSLLLWIVRVPESNDVFLTTRRPPKSTATASDILASLYYLHYTSSSTAVLIRRDGPNNVQENVADISGIMSNSVVISLPTPGYQRLTVPAHERPPALPPHKQNTATASRRGMPLRKPVPGQQQQQQHHEAGEGREEEEAGGKTIFTRVLTVESAFGAGDHKSHKRHHSIPGISKFKHIRRKSSPPSAFSTPSSSLSTPSPSLLSPSPSPSYFSHNTSHSPNPTPSTSPGPQYYQNHLIPPPTSQPTPQKRKKNGYIFVSPWRNSISTSTTIPPDTCEFQSEAMGRFLKLKYYTPTQKASLALLSVVEVVKDAGRNQGAGESTGLHYGGEANGGGVYHSKRTKTKAENSELGMLIVHGMGLEMLDLVVASNLVALMRKWDKWAKERRAVGY